MRRLQSNKFRLHQLDASAKSGAGPIGEAASMGRLSRLDWAVAALALAAITLGLWQLLGARAGLTITTTRVGSTPVEIFNPAGGKPAPVVVIAHGFSGSQQLMQPFALTLAQNGYVALTFDFLGHGRNPEPMPGGLKDQAASGRALLAHLGEIVAFARTLPQGDGRLALLGHSMASDIVVNYAKAHPDIDATVAVSMFSPGATARAPRNLLVIAGALEPAMITNEALRIAREAGGDSAQVGVTYGDFADGTARRGALSPGVEHIGVLYSGASMKEALGWLNATFQRQGSGFIERRGPWLGLLFLGLIALARPLTRLLQQAAPQPLGAGPPWRGLLPLAFGPAILTPLILWKAPTSFLPLLLGDYLVIHFGLYGLLTGAGLWLLRPKKKAPPVAVSWPKIAVAAALVALYGIFAIGGAIDAFLTSSLPGLGRAPLALALLAGTLPFFIADEAATRGPNAPRWAYALTKFCFLLSLALAIALNIRKLFFLIIIAPVILIFFVVYGLISGWTYRRVNHPLAGALALAVIFAWSIAATFPVVAR
jgi:dienelactone hydrolase